MHSAAAGPSRIPAGHYQDTKLGLSYKDTVDTLASFLEIAIHTILCLRNVYPPTTFTRRRAHGVPVYQSRHPEVRNYIAGVVGAIAAEMNRGVVRRVTVVIRSTDTGLPLERFIIDFGYMDIENMNPDKGVVGAPSEEEVGLQLRGMLVRLSALDGQLMDTRGETTFGIVVETKDNAEPIPPADGTPSPWVPALTGDTLNTSAAVVGHHEPLLNVRAVETGIIDLRMMVQECSAKTGVDSLQIDRNMS